MKSLLIIGFVAFASFLTIDCVWVKEMENPGVFEGDMVLDPDEDDRNGNQYASIKGGRWPNAKIPYYITNSIGSTGRTAIANAIADYHKHTCLRFHKRTNERAYISFYRGGGCSSPVGYRYGRRNDVSLAGGCQYKGIVIHEIGHSIGLYHEQSRPDRDEHVEILWNNIQSSMRFNFNKHSRNSINSLGTPYDYESVMHYGSNAFGGRRQTIRTKDPSKQRLIGNRRGFSPIDIKQINLMYCGGTVPSQGPPTQGPSVRPPPPGGCDNKNRECERWAKIGECDRNKYWMANNCCKACKEFRCSNNHARCDEWQKRGECEINPKYMLRVCRLSCKQCTP